MMFSRCVGGPVTWIGTTFGSGSCSCAFADPANVHSVTTAATAAPTNLLINNPSSSVNPSQATLTARTDGSHRTNDGIRSVLVGQALRVAVQVIASGRRRRRVVHGAGDHQMWIAHS